MTLSYMLIDGNSVGYAGQNAGQPFKNADGMEVQAVYNTLRTLRYLKVRFPNHRQWVLWDGRAEFRYDIYPEYKGTRENNEKKRQIKASYKAQKPYIESAIKSLGIPQFVAYEYEADDLAAYMSRYLNRHSKRVLLVTGDHDWMQLVNHGTSWIDHRDKSKVKVCDRENFKQITGYLNGKRFVQGKAVMGDYSDNIGGINGMGKVCATRLLETYGDVEMLFQEHLVRGGRMNPEDLCKPLRRFTKQINELCTVQGEMIFARNMKLMDLLDESRDEHIRKTAQLTASPINMESFTNVCLYLGLNSMVRMADDWERIFGPKHMTAEI